MNENLINLHKKEKHPDCGFKNINWIFKSGFNLQKNETQICLFSGGK